MQNRDPTTNEKIDKMLADLALLRELADKFKFALVEYDTYEVMRRDYIEKYGKDGHR